MMSIGESLQLDEASELLDLARARWAGWVAKDDRLAVVDAFDELRPWLNSRPPVDAVDGVMLALAEFASVDDGDDPAAAAALAKCLLPGACVLARRLQKKYAYEANLAGVARDNEPVTKSTAARIDELVAAALWMEVRSFPWRDVRRVAASVLGRVKRTVENDLGIAATRVLRMTTVTDPTVLTVLCEEPGRTDEELVGSASEFHELLDWARSTEVITERGHRLLLCVVAEAGEVEFQPGNRGHHGLLSNQLSERVAHKMQFSPSTYRREATRTLELIAAAAATRSRDE